MLSLGRRRCDRYNPTMRWWRITLAGILLLAASMVGGQEPAEPQRTVVLELFTSQGCASCPPADHLLSELGAGLHAQGLRVVPLAFHVDYWDEIGWDDPFASPEWSERQRWYARGFGNAQVYTPQLVVDGTLEMVGSERQEVLAAIELRSRLAPGGLELRLVDARLDAEAGQLIVDLHLAGAPDPEAGELTVEVAVFENGFETEVRSGENARRTLRNDYVVRRLAAGGTWPADGHEHRRLRIDLDSSWARSRLGAAVFAQHSQSLEIVAADAAPLRLP